MSVLWVEDESKLIWVGIVGNGFRITLTRILGGWVVRFGEHTMGPYSSVGVAKHEGVRLARKILTQSLEHLSDSEPAPDPRKPHEGHGK